MPNFKVVSLNVCSIIGSNRINLLGDFIQQEEANIFLLQETQTDNTVKIFFPGYIFRGDIRKGWSGTAILVANNIPVRNPKITKDKIHSRQLNVN